MTGKQLKNSILQWAIQGKLVPQNPNDEPAFVLLEKIRAEKARLVKEGKLKKKDLEVKPIAEDEIPFEIPKGWEWCRIKEIFSMQAGKFVSASDISDEQTGENKYPCYGGNGLRGYVRKYNNEGHFTLVGRQGALCGNVQIVKGQFYATEHAVVTDGFDQTEVRWAYYFLTALKLNQYATATAQPGLAVSNILEVLIPLPPLAEQHRIVAKIEELMPLVEKYDAAQEALDEWNQALPEKLKKSILQDAIQGKLVPQDSNDGNAIISNNHKTPKKTSCFDDYLFEIPDNWKWCHLFQIADVIGGYAFQSVDLKSNTGVKVIRISDITPQGLSNKSIVRSSLKDIPSQYAIKDNDILIAMTGGTVGKSLLLGYLSEPMYLNQRVAMIRASKDIEIEYLNLIIKSPLIQLIISDVKNSTNDNISMADILGFPVPLPPLAEQRRIVAKIEELLMLIKS